jgi:hypothetical protein
MALPGVVIETASTIPPRSVPTDTGTVFIAGLFERGPIDALTTENDVIESMQQLEDTYGDRQSYGVAWDWLDAAFREGLHRAYVQRVVGPAVASATLNLAGSSGTTLVVTGKTPGAWANGATGGLTVQVANGPAGASTRVLTIRKNGTVVETTPEYTTQAGFITWSANSDWVTITAGGGTASLPTVAAAANLTSGSDDRPSITQTDVDAALTLFDTDLGPGQVVTPDWQTDAAHLSILAHASTHNRFGLCDPIDTTSKATLLASASALAGGTNASYGMLIAPWITIPGTARGSTGRSVPGSALVAGAAARADAIWGANQAPAGNFGLARYATAVKATFSRQAINGIIDADDLNTAGVNLVVLKYRRISLYGNRTLVTPTGSELNLLQASNARYRMSLVARAKQVGEPYLFSRITKRTIDNFNADLVAMLNRDYVNGDLFGDLDNDVPETAFNVDTTTVNTPTSIQDGELHAAVAYRAAPGAEIVHILLTATAVTESVA